MQVGDLCKVVRKGTHVRCQYDEYVILLKPVNPLNIKQKEISYWETINQSTGEWNHHHTLDLEVVCK